MDYAGAFTYTFSSRDWIKKIVLGVAMFLTPVLGPIVLSGWSLDVLRNLTQGESEPLPNWTGDDFARWLGRGLGVTVVVLTFLLPVIVLLMVLFVLLSVVNAIVIGALNSTDLVGTVGTIFLLCSLCIGVIVFIAVALGTQVVLVRYAYTDRIDVGLDYVKTFQLVGANIVPLIIIVVLLLVWAVISFILTILTLGIFGLVAPVYTSLLFAYFGAQLSQLPGFAD